MTKRHGISSEEPRSLEEGDMKAESYKVLLLQSI